MQQAPHPGRHSIGGLSWLGVGLIGEAKGKRGEQRQGEMGTGRQGDGKKGTECFKSNQEKVSGILGQNALLLIYDFCFSEVFEKAGKVQNG
jgi:hypothetical protein